MADILKISALEKSFGEKKVLTGLDMSVPEHSIFGFIGRNGSGKTTTMKAVLGLIKADAGEIFVCDEQVKFGQTRTNRNIGYLPDVPEFYPFMTPREYLTLCGESLGMKNDEIAKRSAELLEMVGLAGEDRRIKGFSRGMKQRLGIAQALLGRPRLLICDEPTSALDPVGRSEVLDILVSLKSETTVIFSTHILSDVERICNEVALLEKGRIVLGGSIDRLKELGSAEGFEIKLTQGCDADRLTERYTDARRKDELTLRIVGGEDRKREVLSFLIENRIAIQRVETLEPSLEALFMEVVKK
ncbi:MAG: ABC transporter ATP-binding protein [Clostridia bacterium]|nr:ABC transporter ATP-binding protein [Clostridia bacterium]